MPGALTLLTAFSIYFIFIFLSGQITWPLIPTRLPLQPFLFFVVYACVHVIRICLFGYKVPLIGRLLRSKIHTVTAVSFGFFVFRQTLAVQRWSSWVESELRVPFWVIIFCCCVCLFFPFVSRSRSKVEISLEPDYWQINLTRWNLDMMLHGTLVALSYRPLSFLSSRTASKQHLDPSLKWNLKWPETSRIVHLTFIASL